MDLLVTYTLSDNDVLPKLTTLAAKIKAALFLFYEVILFYENEIIIDRFV